MPKQTIVQYLDDLDGAELPDTTEPVLLGYEGTTYKLYLSDANQKKLATAVEKFIKDAETVSPAPARAGAVGSKSDAQNLVEQKGHTFAEVKKWALDKGTFKTAKGEPISDTAPRLSSEVWEQFADEHNL
ncbi:Lsr2 protein [Rhodococcus wratislaviensis]|uniref:Lysyl-tRNA synthetase n=2 Tax=Rhodococcus wratislaviensis TaxID=44752 RepID=A0AB38FGR8_RHOWR|nr:histone-like nucleoid-structuring protein Lsr2 [Rhodococcus wratislaviensis]REE72140.1 Lsr2 protein [Rhodococcus wratislaviensis]SPZ40843.1 lysyl-tRNA synthetase [Rhodococcus wratislaviensis]